MDFKVGDMLINSTNQEVYKVISVDWYAKVYTFQQESDGKILYLHASSEHWLDPIPIFNAATIWEDLNA